MKADNKGTDTPAAAQLQAASKQNPNGAQPQLNRAQNLVRKALILGLTGLAILSMLLGLLAVSHAPAQAAAKPVVVPIQAAKGGDLVVKIYGPASGCDAAGTKEDQTVDFVMDSDGLFHAEMAAGSIASFADIAGMTGVLRSDGSFSLSTSDGRGESSFKGSFDKKGQVSGSWTETNPDTKCTMTVAPLSSWLYFGVNQIDWHTAFGVR